VANGTQLQNLTVAKKVLQYLRKSEDLIRFVQDRSAHDRKYSLDSTKIRQQIGWKPLRDFEDGLGATIDWYRNNEPWWRDALQPRRVS
jgi:dTDP-glucose 4,6-dehydratase